MVSTRDASCRRNLVCEYDFIFYYHTICTSITSTFSLFYWPPVAAREKRWWGHLESGDPHAPQRGGRPFEPRFQKVVGIPYTLQRGGRPFEPRFLLGKGLMLNIRTKYVSDYGKLRTLAVIR